MTEDLRGLVDLETTDRILEDLVIKEYRGKLFEEQHQVVKLPDKNTVYKFLRLHMIFTLDLLDKYGKNHSYLVKNSSDQKVIMHQEVMPIEYSLN
jgi:hypothetical protein